jgi:hypothetical protein
MVNGSRGCSPRPKHSYHNPPFRPVDSRNGRGNRFPVAGKPGRIDNRTGRSRVRPGRLGKDRGRRRRLVNMQAKNFPADG